MSNPCNNVRTITSMIGITTLVITVMATSVGGQASLPTASGSPINVDPTVDCAIRELAWDFAKKLLPQRGDFKLAHDALLLSDCNVSLSDGRQYQQQPFRYQPVILKPPDTIEIFVSATNGDDTKSGVLINDPVKTLSKAIDIYRERKDMTESESADSGVIYIREGTYYLNETIVLGPADSNLIITGYENEQAIISGGIEYDLDWQEIVNEIGQNMLDVNAMYNAVSRAGESNDQVSYYGKVDSYAECLDACENNETCFAYIWYKPGLTGNFSEMCYFRIDGLWIPTFQAGVNSGKKLHIVIAVLTDQDPTTFATFFLNQRRAIRARHPDGNPETMGLYTSPTGYISRARQWLSPTMNANATKVSNQSLERNTTYFREYTVGVGGTAEVFDPPESFWAIEQPDACCSIFTAETGLEYFPDDFIENPIWARPDTGVVHAFQGIHWGNWQFAVQDHDQSNNRITFSKGGYQEARGSSWGNGAEWYVENIREFLDAPGEWYYDDRNSTLFYFPKDSTNLPTSGVGTFLRQLISIKGTIDNPVSNITIANLTFTQTQPTYLDEYEVPSAGDYSVHRGGTVFVEGVKNFLLQNCTFDSPGGNALFLSNYIRGAVIEGNEFVYTGDNAIVSAGSTDLINGTSGNQPRGTQIIGNLMHEIGIWGKQVAGYFQAITAGTVLRDNVMFNGPRAGINFNDGFGGGNLVEYNLIFNMVRETIDNGPFNSWNRRPYLTKLKDGTPSLAPVQSNLTRNFFIANFHSIWPIDHDDASCCYQDTFNYLVYGGFKNNLGYNKVVMNNVYIYPNALNYYSFHDFDYGPLLKPFCIWSNGVYPFDENDVWANNTCIIDNPQIYEFGACKDKKNNSQNIPFSANNYLYSSSPVYIQCELEFWSFEDFQRMGYDSGTKISYDPVSCDTIINWGKELLGLTWNESICDHDIDSAASSTLICSSMYILMMVCAVATLIIMENL